MKLTFKVPFHCYITGPTPESLNLVASFIHSNYKINIRFLLSSPTKEPLDTMNMLGVDNINLDKENRYSWHTQALSFSIEPQSSDKSFKELCLDVKNREKLFSLLIKIANRTFQCIRNFGFVSHVQTINPYPHEAKSYINVWEAQFFEDGKSCPLTEESESSMVDFLIGLQRPISSSFAYDIPTLSTSSWPDIEEALQDNSEPPPEFEFMINAIEFLRLRNFRMALIESLICLEITMSQYLNTYLKIKKELSQTKIKEFLNPNLDLYSRVSVLLNLTLDETKLKDVDITKILDSIHWRNKVIHTTGHLPIDLKEDDLRKGISAVIILSQRLAGIKRQIEAEPYLQSIAKEISENNKMPIPYIKVLHKRSIVADVQFFFKDIPETSVLESFSKQLGEKLGERDPKFDINKHLFIRFSQFPNKVRARWRNGKVEIIEQEKKS